MRASELLGSSTIHSPNLSCNVGSPHPYSQGLLSPHRGVLPPEPRNVMLNVDKGHWTLVVMADGNGEKLNMLS